MSIYDFHSKLVSGGERNVLFAALRKLSRLDPRNLVLLEEAGWPIWDESGAPPPSYATSA
jgi:hypothetical protein